MRTHRIPGLQTCTTLVCMGVVVFLVLLLLVLAIGSWAPCEVKDLAFRDLIGDAFTATPVKDLHRF